MKKLSIILLSFFPLLAGAALSPSLTEISKSFPDVSQVWLKSLITIPSICVVIGQFIPINKLLTPKKQVLLGLFLYSCGAFPLISTSFFMLVLSRIVLGIGLSFLVPQTVGLIQYYYEGATQKTMLGYSSALNNFGTVFAVLYSGFVSNKNWHLVFLIYLLALLSFVMTYLFLPNETNLQAAKETTGKEKISFKLISIWLKMLLLTAIYFTIPTNISFYLSTKFQTHSTLFTGLLMAIISICGVVSGLLFSNSIGKKTTKIQESFIILLFFVSFCLLSFSGSLAGFILGLLLSGWGLGWALPCFNHQLIVSIKDKSSRYLGYGQAMIFLGQFVSPLILTFFSLLFHQKNPFFISIFGVILLFILMFSDFASAKTKVVG